MIYKDLVLIGYEINNYKANLNYDLNYLINNDLLNNLNQKFRHPMLNCDFKFVYTSNNIDYTTYFKTYHTFTSKPINSIFVFQNQYFNICDFIIVQDNFFSINNYKNNNLSIYKIRDNFNECIIKDYIQKSLTSSLIKNKQCPYTQILYINGSDIKMNPTNWLKHLIFLKK